MSSENEQLHNPVTEASDPSFAGDTPAETMHKHDEAGKDLSTDDWLSHLKTPAKGKGDQGPIIREMPDYEESGGVGEGGHSSESPPNQEGEREPKYDHKIKRTDNIGETMEAQAEMAMYAMTLPPKFGAWAITKNWDDPRTKMDDELKGFLMQVMKPVIAKKRNIFSDELFFYAGVLVYLVWCVSTLAIIWKDKKAQEAKEKEIKAKEKEIAALKEELAYREERYRPDIPQAYTQQARSMSHQRPAPPQPQHGGNGLLVKKPGGTQQSALYQLGGTPGKNRAVNRDKYLIDEDGKYCYPPIGWKGTKGLAANGIIKKDSRVGDLVFLADIDDMDLIVYENRVMKGENKGEVAFSRIYKAFQNRYPSDQLDKLENLIRFHIEMQQKHLDMG